MRWSTSSVAAAAAALYSVFQPAAAIDVDVNDPSSVKAAASIMAHSMMQWYVGNETGQIPGILPAPYFWWEAGAVMGSLIDYWYYTGDDTYNDVVSQALIFQASPTNDYMPPNQTTNEGNDDQDFWGFAAMSAAEYKFPDPPPEDPQWLELAQGVWNSQQLRWDTSSCGGGLRWQIFTWNNGYGYKNSPANAGFINMSARLYAYTRNETYAVWANKVWEWMTDINLISNNGQQPGWAVYDGSFVDVNCSTVGSFVQYTYSAGMLLNSAAIMYNITGDSIWEDRVNGIWEACNLFFYDGKILWEQACERPGGYCDTNDLTFKSYFARYMATSTKWMPSLYNTFQPFFAIGGAAAAAQCTGTVAGLYGNACGFTWTDGGKWDGSYGFGQQMDAMQMVLTNIIQYRPDPATQAHGGTSKGNPSAGTEGTTATLVSHLDDITAASRAGAGILTAFVVVSWLGAIWWMYV